MVLFVLFTQYHSVCRKLNEVERENMFQYKTLNDIASGRILELQSFEKTKTAVGDTIIVKYIDTDKADKRVKGQLLMPQRLAKEAMDKIPCIMHYGGKKPGSKPNSKDFHDVHFITPDYFTDSDDTDEELQELLCGKNECDICADHLSHCPGNCPECDAHQPFDGSQCRCVFKGFARRKF